MCAHTFNYCVSITCVRNAFVCAGRVKRKNMKKTQGGGGGDEEED